MKTPFVFYLAHAACWIGIALLFAEDKVPAARAFAMAAFFMAWACYEKLDAAPRGKEGV